MKLTQEERRRFEATQKDASAARQEAGMIAFVALLVKRWDFPDPEADDGAILPVGEAGARWLGYEALFAITRAIGDVDSKGGERRVARLTRGLTGEVGGEIDSDYVLLAAARELGVPWDRIASVPEHIVRAAWQNCVARESAAMEIAARSRGV